MELTKEQKLLREAVDSYPPWSLAPATAKVVRDLFDTIAARDAEIERLRKALDLANTEYNRLRKSGFSYPPLDNKGRWLHETGCARASPDALPCEFLLTSA